jgi:flagellar biosynthesis protein FliQ
MNELIDVANDSLRVLIILCLPLTVAGLVAGLIVATIRGFTVISDPVIGYVFKLCAVGIVVILMWETLIEQVSELLLLALN